MSMIKLAYPDLKAVNFSVGRSKSYFVEKVFGKFLSYESCNSNTYASTHGHDMHDFMCGAFLTRKSSRLLAGSINLVASAMEIGSQSLTRWR